MVPHASKSKPLPMLFEVTVDGETQLVSAETIQNDAKFPYGVYVGNMPCLGETLHYKVPNALRNLEEVYHKYKDTIDILADYVDAKPKGQDHLTKVKEILDRSYEDRMCLSGCIFVSMLLTRTQQQKIFQVLLNELGQDLTAVMYLVKMYKAMFTVALDVCGPQFLSANDGYFPIEFSLITGEFKVNDLDRIKQFWARGGDPNHTHRKFGTILHVLVANESHESALYLIDELKQKKTTPIFDFTTRDGEGKTLLLLAAKTRANIVVAELCELHKQGIDVGLDLQDPQGRTAIMIAAGLGDTNSFAALLEAGANRNVRDEQGRDLEFYVNAAAELIREILLSIAIEPERSAIAPYNWLYYLDSLRAPVTHEDSTHKDKLVLISFEEPHATLLKKVMLDAIAMGHRDLLQFYASQLGVFPSSYHLVMWLNGAIEIKTATLLEDCMKGKEEVREKFAAANTPAAPLVFRAAATAASARQSPVSAPEAAAAPIQPVPNVAQPRGKRRFGFSMRGCMS